MADLLKTLQVPNKAKDLIKARFGANIESILAADPYVIVDVPGVSFKAADGFAQKLKFSKLSHERKRGAVLFSFALIAQRSGSTAMTEDQLLASAHNLVRSITIEEVQMALDELAEADVIVKFDTGKYASKMHFEAEVEIADFFNNADVKPRARWIVNPLPPVFFHHKNPFF